MILEGSISGITLCMDTKSEDMTYEHQQAVSQHCTISRSHHAEAATKTLVICAENL